MMGPTDSDDRRIVSRRTALAAATTGALTVLAGCSGGGGAEDGTTPTSEDSTTVDGTTDAGTGDEGEGDDGAGDEGDGGNGNEGSDDSDGGNGNEGSDDSDTEGSASTEGTAHRFEEDVPPHPGFLANPDVSGPGGDAELLVPFGISNRGEAGEFETLVLGIEEVVLETSGGDAVAVPIDVEFDLTEFEYGGMVRGDTITAGWLLEIPAAHYTAVEYGFSPVELVHESDGDVTDRFEPAGSYPLGDDGEGVEVEADVLFRPLPDFRVTYEPWDDRLALVPEGESVGFHTMPGQYFDPSEYGA